MTDNSQPGEFGSVFPEVFELDEPERIYLNPSISKEDIEAIGPIITTLASKELSETARIIRDKEQEQEE